MSAGICDREKPALLNSGQSSPQCVAGNMNGTDSMADTGITIDQWIALGASVGACASAFATFRTVGQMKMQREATYRPELLIESTQFQMPFRTHAETGALQKTWYTHQEDVSEEKSPDFKLYMRNIGLGTAKDIEVIWQFDGKK